MEKQEIITQYITKDLDTFKLALDIYQAFPVVKNYIVNDIYTRIVEIVKNYTRVKFKKIIPSLATNNQYLDFTLNDDILLQAIYYNYFKYLTIGIRCLSQKKDFGQDKDILQVITGLYEDNPNATVKQLQWGQINIVFQDYSFNIIDDEAKLFQLYQKDEQLSHELIQSTEQYLANNLEKLSLFFTSTYKV